MKKGVDLNMKRTTPSRNSTDNNIKRTKLQSTTLETNRLLNQSITYFEDLSNELFYEIFEFLDFHHVFEAFSELNSRFQNLLLYSIFPLKINISFVPKSTFQRYYTQIIIPNIHQINTLRLSNLCSTNIISSLLPIISKFTCLKSLSLNNIRSEYIENLLNSLLFLPNLSSLTIESFDQVQNQNNLYRQIFRLPVLKYCQVLFRKTWIPIPLPLATNEFSPIEHFVFNNIISFNQFDSLLSYIPQIRRLSFRSVEGFYDNRIRLTPVVLSHLTHLSIRLYSITFNQFRSLIKKFFRHVQVLSVLVDENEFSFETQYLDAIQWERLILSHMPHLRIFDFQHRHIILEKNVKTICKTLDDKFTSAFWMERQWHFAYKYYQNGNGTIAIFYSTNPYRRKYYALYEVTERQISSQRSEININSVHHLCISSEQAIRNCLNYFPNVDELILLHNFDEHENSIATSLTRIISSRKLNKLLINYHRFSFEQLIELLSFTTNIHTLQLSSLYFDQTDSRFWQSSKSFRLVSTMNTITNVVIENECTLEKIQLLVHLFPQLEHLTIKIYNQDWKAILRFLLVKSRRNDCHLFSVCISNVDGNLKNKLKILIESERLIIDYIIQVFGYILYLWW